MKKVLINFSLGIHKFISIIAIFLLLSFINLDFFPYNTKIDINQAYADSRIKDIVYFEGIRDNMLVGYGLVVGLNGTGDNLRNAVFTQNGLIEYLNRLGVSAQGANLNTRNVAAVIVTANLKPFARPGSKMPINISTLGDAKNLKGGTLLATQLLAADGQVYAVAQGLVSIGNLSSDSTNNNVKPVPTSGYIMNGATVETAVDFDMNSLSEVRLSLKNVDITTARAVATAINAAMQEQIAYADDPGTVRVKVPYDYRKNVVGLLAEIESLPITPDTTAKIIIDEATGTIVIGDNVKISNVAVAQGNLVIKVSDEDKFNFLVGATKNKPEPSLPGTKMIKLENNANLSDLVQGLNTLGVKPQDLIAILKTIQQAGALQAIIEIN